MRAARILAITLAFFAGITVHAVLDGGWNVIYSSTSPNGRYRVDLYRGRLWQRLGYAPWFQQPGFARLSRTSDDKVVATSRVIELADSPVRWTVDGPLISSQTEYRYRDARWH